MDLKIVYLGRKEYKKTLDIQRILQRRRIRGEIKNTLLVVEHPAVLTLGSRGSRDNIIADTPRLREMGVDIVEVERGGDVTYHGPGQAVGYPIVDLKDTGRDIKKFVSNIQDAVIGVLRRHYGIAATKRHGVETGVWVGNDKIAAIGISVKKWVSMHGFAFNVNTDLSHFRLIVPCGLKASGVTSLQKILGKPVEFASVCRQVAVSFSEVFGFNPVEQATEEINLEGKSL